MGPIRRPSSYTVYLSPPTTDPCNKALGWG
jgi:hypothetical protein